MAEVKQKFDRIREICGGWGLYEAGASTEQAQILKALSEVGELADSILKNDCEQAKDDIGDILVCLANADSISKYDSLPPIELFAGGMRTMSRDYALPVLLYELSEGLTGDIWCRLTMTRCLHGVADSFGLTLEECLDQAISVIEKRKGKIINGAFVKDAD